MRFEEKCLSLGRNKQRIRDRDMGKFSLMALPYAPEALEPVISKETIAFHHGKHLAVLWQIIDWEVIEERCKR